MIELRDLDPDSQLRQLNSSEALMGFLGWLTTREEPVTFSSKHDAAIAVELFTQYQKAQGLPEIRNGYGDLLEPMA